MPVRIIHYYGYNGAVPFEATQSGETVIFRVEHSPIGTKELLKRDFSEQHWLEANKFYDRLKLALGKTLSDIQFIVLIRNSLAVERVVYVYRTHHAEQSSFRKSPIC